MWPEILPFHQAPGWSLGCWSEDPPEVVSQNQNLPHLSMGARGGGGRWGCTMLKPSYSIW